MNLKNMPFILEKLSLVTHYKYTEAVVCYGNGPLISLVIKIYLKPFCS